MPAANAITTKAVVKTFLNITGATQDTFLDDLIDRVSSDIERFIRGPVVSTTYTNEITTVRGQAGFTSEIGPSYRSGLPQPQFSPTCSTGLTLPMVG